MKRVAITGSSGYLGQGLTAYLRQQRPELEILGIDIAGRDESSDFQTQPIDVRSSDLQRAIAQFQPDTIIHLAFVIAPQHNWRQAHEINVGGTQNLLKAAALARSRRVAVASSTTALGAWPDNPDELDDRHPPRPREQFSYTVDKAAVERMTDQFSRENPDTVVSWFRPCIVGGPSMDNYLRRVLLQMPMVVLIDGVDNVFQMVHQRDVARAICKILTRDARGPFNIAPADTFGLSDLAERTTRRAIRLPFWIVWALASIAWKTRFKLHEFPPGLLYYCRYPWIAAANRLRNELGFRFEYSSSQTLDDTITGETGG